MNTTAKLIIVVLSLSLVLGGQVIDPSDPYINYVGRFTSKYQFEWSGVQISAAFTGTSLKVLLQDGGNMYNVFVDGNLYWLNGTTSTTNYTVATGLSSATHVVLITKRTEAFFGVASFLGFELDDGASLVATSRLSRKIEFIGDSITCGYGDLGHYPCSFDATTEDNYLSYGPVTAREFAADLHLEAWSGMGMVRNYGDKNATSTTPFPALFPYVLPSLPQVEWNFTQWVPDVVVINLGTNDYSTQPYPPQDTYEDAYVNFIATYTKLYGGHPKFFLACGPMQNSATCPYVQNVASKTGATYVDLLNLLDFPTDFGCDYHPAVTGHAKMANATITAIRQVLGW